MRKLISELKKKVQNGYKIDRRKYNISTTYGFDIEEDLIIISVPGLGSKGVRTKYTDKLFQSIKCKLQTEEKPDIITYELGWENSLEWLFNFYPYGKDDNSNSICINGAGQIIGVQYNGSKNTSIIKSLGCPITKDYIVINKEIKLKGKYNLKDIENLLELIKEYFNNK